MRGFHGGQVAALILAVGLGVVVVRPGRSAQAAGAQAVGTSGRFYYLRDCAVCHGADGSGTNRGSDLRDVGRATIDFWISTGRMPLVSDPARDPATGRLQPLPAAEPGDPYAEPRRHNPAYPPEVVAELVDYVGTLGPGGPDVPRLSLADADVSAGGEVYRLECAACHSWSGTGGALYQREAPSLDRATPIQIAEAIRTGPDQMPAFGRSAIPDDRLNDVVAYVRYLDHPNDRGGQPLWHLGPVAEGGVAIIIGMGILLLAIRWIGERA